MGSIIHLAVDANRAGARLRGEGRDNRFRLLNLSGRRCEHVIDDRYLGRMNGQTPGKAVAAGGFGIAAQTL